MNPKYDMFLSGMEVLVNPVNCFGACGKGLALQFKSKFPAATKAYIADCKYHKRYKPGICILYKENNTYIANLATENHWRDGAKEKWISESLKNLRHIMKTHHFSSVAIPRIGCGLGGLNWNKIRPLILKELEGVPFTIWLDGEIIPPAIKN